MKLILVLISFLAFSPFSYGEDLVVEKELRPYFLRFNIVRTTLEIEHRETSSSTGFEALGKRIKMNENSLDFILGREFVRMWPVSISLFVTARANVGNAGEQNSGDEENIDYDESMQGYGIGSGASLNFNFRILETRTQFFFATQGIKQKNKYFLRYSNDDLEERSRELETNEESTSIQSSFGIRVYNLFNGYTFNVAVHHNDYSSDKIGHKASQGEDRVFEIEDGDGPIFTRGNTAYSIGFGGTF